MNDNNENPIIEALNWRYATKKFDATKTISHTHLSALLESIRLSPSSYGLQPFKVFVVQNQATREQIKSAAYNQTQVTDASHLLVFAAQKSVSTKDVDAYMNNVATTRKVTLDQVQGFGDYIKNSIEPLSPEKFLVWNEKQCYIALGMLLHTAAQLKIDSTPMEGFEKEKVDDILDFKNQNLTTTLICPLGYRHKDDKNQWQAKVRKPKEQLIKTI